MAIGGGGVVRIELIDRGDPIASDFTQADMTLDNAWHDLDLSAIVPADAIWVMFIVELRHNVGDGFLQFRKNGNANVFASPKVYVQVVNEEVAAQMLVPCDDAQIIEYRADLNIQFVTMTILGWICGS